jgi:hypothetical protein
VLKGQHEAQRYTPANSILIPSLSGTQLPKMTGLTVDNREFRVGVGVWPVRKYKQHPLYTVTQCREGGSTTTLSTPSPLLLAFTIFCEAGLAFCRSLPAHCMIISGFLLSEYHCYCMVGGSWVRVGLGVRVRELGLS